MWLISIVRIFVNLWTRLSFFTLICCQIFLKYMRNVNITTILTCFSFSLVASAWLTDKNSLTCLFLTSITVNHFGIPIVYRYVVVTTKLQSHFSTQCRAVKSTTMIASRNQFGGTHQPWLSVRCNHCDVALFPKLHCLKTSHY